MNCLILEEPLDGDLYRVLRTTVERSFGMPINDISPGRKINIAFLGGERGVAEISAVMPNWIDIRLVSLTPSLPLEPIDLIVGLSRPQTTKKVLQIAVMLGVRSLHFVSTSRGQKSYAEANIFNADTLQQEVIKSLEQIGHGCYPEIKVHRNFHYFEKQHLTGFAKNTHKLIATPNSPMFRTKDSFSCTDSIALSVGPEAGWSREEVAIFESAGFSKIGLGERVVRVEVAVSMLLGQVAMLRV